MKSQRPDLLENIIEPYWRVAIPISISHVCRRYANVGTRIDQFSISGGRSTCDPAQKKVKRRMTIFSPSSAILPPSSSLIV